MDDFLDFNGDSMHSSITGKPIRGTRIQMDNMAPNNPGRSTEAQILKPLAASSAAEQAASAEFESGPKNLSVLRTAITEQKDPALKKILTDHYNQLSSNKPADDFADFSSASIHADVKKLPVDKSTPVNAEVKDSGIKDTRSITGSGKGERQFGYSKGGNKPIESPGFDFIANQASSLGSTIAGGYTGMYKGLKTLLQTGDKDKALSDAVSAIDKVREGGTFEPRTQQGQKAIDGFNSPYNPLMLPVTASQAVGDNAGDALASNGMPGAGAVVKGLGAAAPLALGFKSARSELVNLNDMMKKRPPAPEIAPPAPKPAYKLVDGKPELINGGIQIPSITPPITSLGNASPELQQRVQTAKQNNTYINETALNRHIESETLHVPVKMTEGQSLLDPSIISNEMNGRGKEKPTVSPDFYNAQGKALGKNLDVVRSNLSPNVVASHSTDIGQAILNEYKVMDKPVRKDISDKYQALQDGNGGQFPLDGMGFMAETDRKLAENNKAAFLPAEVEKTLSVYRNGGPMSFNNFENLRTILGAAERKAAKAGDGNAEHAISTARDALESLPMTNESSAIKPLADAARNAAKARFNRLASDPAYKAAVNDSAKVNEPSPLADNFYQSYVINGKGANVRQMRANLSGSKIAQEHIAAGGVDYLKGLAKADPETGKFLSDQYNKGIDHLGPKMDDIFGANEAAMLKKVGNVGKYTTAQPKGSYVNNSSTLVGAVAELAKSGIEGMVNLSANGVPIATWARKGLQYNSAKKAAAASTETGAGIGRPPKD